MVTADDIKFAIPSQILNSPRPHGEPLSAGRPVPPEVSLLSYANSLDGGRLSSSGLCASFRFALLDCCRDVLRMLVFEADDLVPGCMH